jgi:hypothetical protein
VFAEQRVEARERRELGLTVGHRVWTTHSAARFPGPEWAEFVAGDSVSGL